MSVTCVGSPRFDGTCKRCGSLFRYAATLPKSVENDAYDIYQCVDCKSIEWQTRKDPPKECFH